MTQSILSESGDSLLRRDMRFCIANACVMTGEARGTAELMQKRRSFSGLILPIGLLFIGAYFTFAAVQGDYGLFQRMQVEAERDRLQDELARLEDQVARMEILTHRLSDDYLDLDLLDERVRSVLGYVRPDELVLP